MQFTLRQKSTGYDIDVKCPLNYCTEKMCPVALSEIIIKKYEFVTYF